LPNRGGEIGRFTKFQATTRPSLSQSEEQQTHTNYSINLQSAAARGGLRLKMIDNDTLSVAGCNILSASDRDFQIEDNETHQVALGICSLVLIKYIDEAVSCD
jgi:hypothetical protein